MEKLFVLGGSTCHPEFGKPKCQVDTDYFVPILSYLIRQLYIKAPPWPSKMDK